MAISARALTTACVAIALACTRERKAEPPVANTNVAPAVASTSTGFNYAERIGWVQGGCLSIQKIGLARGAPVTVVITASPQVVRQARIVDTTTSPAICQALMADRAPSNAAPGVAFYSIAMDSTVATDMGVGIVSSPALPSIVNGAAHVDLEGNGQSIVFSSCATTEGIKFGAWSDKAYQGTARWTAYYYLGYDVTPSCP